MAKPQAIYRQKLFREAEGYLDLATALDDKWPLTSGTRDCVVSRALRLLQHLGKSEIRRHDVYYLKGQAFRIMKRHGDAVEALLAATELDPDNVHAHLALAWCYKRLDRVDLAIQVLEDALSVDPSIAIVHYNLACYWSLANNASRAIECLARSFDLEPDLRDQVANEPDFDPIRAEPDFLALTSVIV